MDTWEKHILNRGEESTSIAALVYFKLRYFSILWKFSLQNNKNFSAEINSKPKNSVGWTVTFLSRPLSNKVIGSTELNLGNFLRPNISILYVSLWFKNFVCSSDTEFRILWEFKEEKPYANTTYYKLFLLFRNGETPMVTLNCRF